MPGSNWKRTVSLTVIIYNSNYIYAQRVIYVVTVPTYVPFLSDIYFFCVYFTAYVPISLVILVKQIQGKPTLNTLLSWPF